MCERKGPRYGVVAACREGCKAGCEERTNVVDCRGGVEVGGEEAFGVGEAVVGVDAVHVVTAERDTVDSQQVRGK